MQNDQFKIMLQRILEGFEVCPYFPKIRCFPKKTLLTSLPHCQVGQPQPEQPQQPPEPAQRGQQRGQR